jgi:hypothetical protein
MLPNPVPSPLKVAILFPFLRWPGLAQTPGLEVAKGEDLCVHSTNTSSPTRLAAHYDTLGCTLREGPWPFELDRAGTLQD